MQLIMGQKSKTKVSFAQLSSSLLLSSSFSSSSTAATAATALQKRMLGAQREEVTESILEHKRESGLTWADVAAKVNRSKEWTTAACLGQFAMPPEEAAVIAGLFELSESQQKILTLPPYKADQDCENDPLIYRLNEAVALYGPAIKELIHEQFGDGIMSSVDLKVKVEKEENPNGDRVKLTLSGKFLPYTPY